MAGYSTDVSDDKCREWVEDVEVDLAGRWPALRLWGERDAARSREPEASM